MLNLKKPYWISILVLIILTTSCIPRKKMLLLQNDPSYSYSYSEEYLRQNGIGTDYYRIQPNDALFINVASINNQTVSFFNTQGGDNLNYNASNQMMSGYFVSDSGTIYMPFIGNTYVWNYTTSDVRELLEKKLKKYASDAVVTVKLMNNTISILGEVNKEGTFRITKPKLTIFEAISLAQGLTIHANLKDIQIIRNTRKGPEVFSLDISKEDVMNYKLYYIFPNDVIYIEPMKSKSLGLGTSFNILSTLTAVVTLYLLMQSIN